MICVTATESGTDEDCEAAGRITKSLIDHYMRQPSMEDMVMEILAKECNKSLFVPGRPDASGRCDMAALLMMESDVRWLVSGTSHVYYFLNHKLAASSGDKPYPLLGERLSYAPVIDPGIQLQAGKNAFLLASERLAELVSVPEMEEALAQSKNAAEWMDKLVQLAGPDAQFCATTIFVPPMQSPSFFQRFRPSRPARRP